MGAQKPTVTPKDDHLSRRDFIKAAGLIAGSLALAACQQSLSTQPVELPVGNAIKTNAPSPFPPAELPPTVMPTAGIAEPTVSNITELARIQNSFLMIPKETSEKGNQAIAKFLVGLIIAGKKTPTTYHQVPYINNPSGGIPQNDDPTLLTGVQEPGQSMEALDNQPLSNEVRLYSTGQVVLPLTTDSDSNLESSVTVSELRDDGKRNVHLVYKKVQLADGRPGILIPGGKDDDHNVNTPDDNVNRGNIFIMLPPTEQGNTALAMQVDTRSNWLAQFKLHDIVSSTGGINASDLIPYLLYDPDAQRSESHGLSTMESMYEGLNCQGAGCRVVDDTGTKIADMAGIGVYIVQLDPKAQGINLLAATVLPDSEIPALIKK